MTIFEWLLIFASATIAAGILCAAISIVIAKFLLEDEE